MSHLFVTTETIEQTIPIVVFDEMGLFSEELQIGLAHYPTTVTFFETLPETDAQLAQLHQAYKIVCVIHPLFFSTSQFSLLEFLKEEQDKVVCILPLLSQFSQQIRGEIPDLEDALAQQQYCVDLCTSFLSRATCIFAKDVLLKPGLGSIFDYLLQHLEKKFVFVPHSFCSIVSKEMALEAVVRELLRPERTSSCIQGQKRSFESVLKKMMYYYDQYYHYPTNYQFVHVEEQQVIPFPLRTTIIRESIEDACRLYTQDIPSPQQLPFSHPVVVIPEVVDGPIQPSVPSPVEEIIKSDYQVIEDALENGNEPAISISESNDTPEFTEAIPVEEFNLQGEISKIFTVQRGEQKKDRITEVVGVERKISVKKKKKTVLFYGGLLFTSLGLLVGIVAAVFMVSKSLLLSSINELVVTTFSNQKIPENVTTRINFFSQLVTWENKVFSIFVELPVLDEATTLTTIPQAVAETVALQKESQERLTRLIHSILGSGEVPLVSNEIEALQALSVPQKNEELLSLFEQVGVSESVIQIAQEKLKNSVDDSSKQLEKNMSFVVSTLPQLVGEQSRKSYALVFQNNQELRPTGGFIEAIAILTFEKGTLLSQKVYSSYEIDKMMPGEIVAPQEIAQYTGEKRLTFFETNWEPDLPTAAEKIRFFVEKSLGTSVNGILTIDLFGMQNLLEVTGPLDLPEYNEVVTSKNIFERVESHSEVVLVPNAQQRDYRALLLEKFIQKVTSLTDEKAVGLISVLLNNFNSRSMQFSVTDPVVEAGLQNMGWTGSIITPPCPTEFSAPCFVDTFMIVETNVGVNKANAYITRTSAHHVDLEKNTARHTHSLDLENISTSGAWPKGTYKTYVRSYLPAGAHDILITADAVQIPSSAITISQQLGKKVVGFATEIPIQTKKKIKITYVVDTKNLASEQLSYVFVYQKQAGLPQDSVAIDYTLVGLPSPQLITPHAVVQDQMFTFVHQLKPIELYGFQFQQAK